MPRFTHSPSPLQDIRPRRRFQSRSVKKRVFPPTRRPINTRIVHAIMRNLFDGLPESALPSQPLPPPKVKKPKPQTHAARLEREAQVFALAEPLKTRIEFISSYIGDEIIMLKRLRVTKSVLGEIKRIAYEYNTRQEAVAFELLVRGLGAFAANPVIFAPGKNLKPSKPLPLPKLKANNNPNFIKTPRLGDDD